MSLDDELMPAAPAPATAAGAPAVVSAPFSGEIDVTAYEKVPEMGEALPAGTYHFRLDSYREGWGDPPKPGDALFAYGAQPYFMVKWTAQQEPITGRAFIDFCPWVSDQVAQAAGAGDQAAQAVVTDRIWKLKTIATAAGYKPPAGGRFNAKTFLSSNPEVKISLGVQERKSKNTDGTYSPTGQQGNRANAYLPLFGGPAR